MHSEILADGSNTDNLSVGLIVDFLNENQTQEWFNSIRQNFKAIEPNVELNIHKLSRSTNISNVATNLDVFEIRTNEIGKYVAKRIIAPWESQAFSSENLTAYADTAIATMLHKSEHYAITHLLEGLFYITSDQTLTNTLTVDDLVNKLSHTNTVSKAKLASFELNQHHDLIRLLMLSKHQSAPNTSTIHIFENLSKFLDLCQAYGKSQCLDTTYTDKEKIERDLVDGNIAAIIGNSHVLSELQGKYPHINFYISNLAIGNNNTNQILSSTLFVKNAICAAACANKALSFVNFINSDTMLDKLLFLDDRPNYLMPSTKTTYQIKGAKNIDIFNLLSSSIATSKAIALPINEATVEKYTAIRSNIHTHTFGTKEKTLLAALARIQNCPSSKYQGNKDLNSQLYEDYVLSFIFEGVMKGFYVDVGVNNPYSDNVSYYFHKLGWSGMNIEPIKKWFKSVSMQRPNAINVNVAVSNFEGDASFFQPENNDALSSLDEKTVSMKRLQGEKIEEIKVKVDTLSNVFAKHHIDGNNIDFIKIDVENKEKEVLQGLDFTKYRAKVLVVESASPLNFYGFMTFEDLIIANGYRFGMSDGQNMYYFRKESPELRARFDYIDTCVKIDHLIREVRCQSKHYCNIWN